MSDDNAFGTEQGLVDSSEPGHSSDVRRAGILAVGLLVVLFVAVASCSDGTTDDDATKVSTTPSRVAPDACELLTAEDAAKIIRSVGSSLTRLPGEAPKLVSDCVYVDHTVAPAAKQQSVRMHVAVMESTKIVRSLPSSVAAGTSAEPVMDLGNAAIWLISNGSGQLIVAHEGLRFELGAVGAGPDAKSRVIEAMRDVLNRLPDETRPAVETRGLR